MRISANNVRDVLGKLTGLGIAKRVNSEQEHYPLYALTERGQRFRDLLDQAMSLPIDHASQSLPTHLQPQAHRPLIAGGNSGGTSGVGGDDE